MARIVPQKQNTRTNLPSWMDPKELIGASKDSVQSEITIPKTAAAKSIVTEFVCTGCGNRFYPDNKDIVSQINLAKRSGKELGYFECPKCKAQLTVSKTVEKASSGFNRYSDQIERRVDLQKEASGTYNTYTDRHIANRAMDALARFASKLGMTAARARYIRSEHKKEAGQEYPIINGIECELIWQYGKKQFGRVTASVEIDIAGKIKMPKVFKVSSGETYPFETEYIRELEEKGVFAKVLPDTMKKTNQPQYKKPDISRFKAIASKNDGETDNQKLASEIAIDRLKKKSKSVNIQKESFTSPPPVAPVAPQVAPIAPPQQQFQQQQPVVNPIDGKTYNVKQTNPDGSVSIIDPSTNQESVVTKDQVGGLKPVVKTGGIFDFLKSDKGEIVAKVDIYEGNKISIYPRSLYGHRTFGPKSFFDRMSNEWKDVVLVANKGEIITPKSDMDIGEFITESGKDIFTHSHSLAKGYTVEDLFEYRKTAPYTASKSTFSAEEIANELLREHLKGDIGEEWDEAEQEMDLMHRDVNEIQRDEEMLGEIPDVTIPEIEQHLNVDRQGEEDSMQTHEEMIEGDRKEMVEDQELLKKLKEEPLMKNPNIGTESRRWSAKRKEIQAQMDAEKEAKLKKVERPIYSLSRQEYAAKELGFSPQEPDKDKTGHDKATGLPFAEDKDIIIGLTEFPKDQKKEDSTGQPLDNERGYRIPFKKMNENQVKEREHFDNEKRLTQDHKQRSEDKSYETEEQDLGLSEQRESALNKVVGIAKKSDFENVEDNHNSEVATHEVIEEMKDRIWNEISSMNNRWSGIERDLRSGSTYGYSFSDTQIEEIRDYINYKLDQTSMAVNSSLKKKSDGEAELPVKGPIRYTPLKTAPKIKEYNEPAVIHESEGKVKEAITKLKQTQEEIKKLKEDLKTKIAPIQETLKQIQDPLNKEIGKKEELFTSYVEMAFDQLQTAEDHVKAYENEIFASFEREDTQKVNITISQLIKRVDESLPEVAEQIKKLVTLLESESARTILERYLYEYPLSKSHEKRVTTSAIEGTIEQVIGALKQWIKEMGDINQMLIADLVAIGG